MKTSIWNLANQAARNMRRAGAALLLPIAIVQPAFGQSDALTARIRSKATALSADLIEVRRHLHMHPELSGQEEQTAALVAARMEKLGLKVTTGIGGHGVVGVLRGGLPGPVVAYRADMDAVRSPVVGDASYRSTVDGVKHVCGHDAHVAIALGIAEVLASMQKELPGTVKFIFQPSEENAQGALAMIRDGVLEKPRPHAIFAIHTFPLPVGTMGCPPGVGLSGYEPFEIRLEGSGNVDAAQQSALEAIHAMNTVPPITGPETFVMIREEILKEDGVFEDYVFIQGLNAAAADGATRVVSGGVRAAHRATYARAREQIESIAKRVSGDGVTAVASFSDASMPNMHSDAELVRAAKEPIEAVMGSGSTTLIYASVPYFGEDFAYFQEHIPGAMLFLGVANADTGLHAFNHLPDYDIDESALELGTATMANVLLNYLQSK